MQVRAHPLAARRITITDVTVQDDIYYGVQTSEDVPALAEVTSPAAVARLKHRPDVVRRSGRYALINQNRTPYQAMVEDLLFLRNVLAGAGLDYLLVRGNNDRPVIALDWKNRKKLRAALVDACRNEPFYSMTVDAKKKTSVLVADGELSTSRQARIFRLYRPRVEPTGGFEFGASAGVQVELWSFEGDELILPIENSLTRRTMLTQDAVRGTVERYGHTWPTIENMFADHASDISFDIDLVFSWVDGSSPEYIAARRARQANAVLGEGDDHEARYRQINELKYALRSVYMFAPWIRRIFIATDSPAPEWLADHPSVTIVRSEEFFADPSVLPTHNSQAVECQLHHIEGLSEHFLYSNDDMFFGRPVGPDLFFTPGGITKFIEAETRIGLGENAAERSGFENAARVNRKLLWNRFGRITTRHLEHSAAPLRRSVVAQMEEEFPNEFAKTAASTFRAADNISVTNSFYHYYALLTGRAVTQTAAKVRYVDTTLRAGLNYLPKLLAKRNMDFFCLNDGSFPEVPGEERAELVTDFLEKYFPIKAPWEK
ncbi:stealth conserved region 3 domain-containing protein [Arthrobacter sp. ISL-28]|uniref:stealth conserved region 3 domain-containing protein n=1 Tax=Arthrobacter sp. ISL-28 TaxID=2819108 RepID=UPI001BE6CD22|nr:stealth conserved region 3 domain-containing protein [Arthrobacter sp. ISL-28]MBT2523659.1 stealth family protein [Arthrobacter sp. ISL-28]